MIEARAIAGLFFWAVGSIDHGTAIMILPMDISAVLVPFVTEALHDLGLWAAAPALLVLVVWEVRRKLQAKDQEISDLRDQVDELQEKRLQEAREMIRITESSTAATASRTQSDERFADMLEAVLRRHARGGLFGGWR